MPLIRRIARPLLASVFVYGGIDTLRNPAAKAPAADNVVGGLAKRLPSAPSTEQVVRADALAKIVAGTTLAFGKSPRISSTVLAASLVPTTLAGHRFWEETDPTKKAQQRLHFLKNASMLGGLILAAVDTEGRPSLAWRARKASARTSRSVAGLADSSRRSRRDAAKSMSTRAFTLLDAARTELHTAADTVEAVASRTADTVGEFAGRTAESVGEFAGRAAETAGDVASRTAATAGDVASRTAATAGEVASRAAATAGDVASRTIDTAGDVATRTAETVHSSIR